jgi:hypothetical protein
MAVEYASRTGGADAECGATFRHVSVLWGCAGLCPERLSVGSVWVFVTRGLVWLSLCGNSDPHGAHIFLVSSVYQPVPVDQLRAVPAAVRVEPNVPHDERNSPQRDERR